MNWITYNNSDEKVTLPSRDLRERELAALRAGFDAALSFVVRKAATPGASLKGLGKELAEILDSGTDTSKKKKFGTTAI